MTRPLDNNSEGFSLVEIMVIVVIVGMLIAAGVVSYSRAVDQARDEQVKAAFEQVRTSLELYRRGRSAQVYPNTLIDLQAAGHTVPNHPATNDLAGYNYTPSPAGCESTSSCISYQMTSQLKGEDAEYIATPQSLVSIPTNETPQTTPIQLNPTYTATPPSTSTPIPTVAPTNTPVPTIPFSLCLISGTVCEDVSGKSLGTCCDGLSCSITSVDGVKRCAITY